MRETKPALVKLDSINEPPHQLRLSFDAEAMRQLADDIARRGLLQRIRLHEGPEPERYTICAGHRRFLAMRLLGWWDVPAEIAPPCANCTDGALAENIQRADLTPIEEARAIERLYDSGKTTGEIAHMVRRSEAWVAQRAALLQLPEDLRDAIHLHRLPVVVAGALARIDHAPYREYLTRDAIANGASARTVESWVMHYLANRDQLQTNTAMVEEIAARRDDYVITVPCDYCAERKDLTRTTSWRLCADCHGALHQARREFREASQSSGPQTTPAR